MCLLFDHFCRGLAVVPYIHGFSIYHNQWKLSACLNLELEWLVPFDMIASVSANLTLGLHLLVPVAVQTGYTICFFFQIIGSTHLNPQIRRKVHVFHTQIHRKVHVFLRYYLDIFVFEIGLLDVFLLYHNETDLKLQYVIYASKGSSELHTGNDIIYHFTCSFVHIERSAAIHIFKKTICFQIYDMEFGLDPCQLAVYYMLWEFAFVRTTKVFIMFILLLILLVASTNTLLLILCYGYGILLIAAT
ncbi:hypothetical protein ACJX0J_034684, partial [Zea mays]